ncbi:hypothetical protein EBR66_02390 [bacterium]|nr:hypothetical protein [bacterium]
MSQAANALTRAEAIDGYRAACQACPLNAAARTKQIYTPTFLEKNQLDRLVKALYTHPLAKTTDVVVLHPSADNGYPHTRPNSIICMPASTITSMSDSSLANTILHEAIHIHQRRHPDIWENACKKEGWTPVSANQIPAEYIARTRINPDTMSCPYWAWETHSVPLPLFIREDYPTMEGVRIKWLDLRTRATVSEPPPSFTARYGSPSQPEHPYEILAVSYANEIVNTDESLRRKLESM